MAPRLSMITLSMWWLAAGGGAMAANAKGRSDRPTWDSDGQGTSVSGQRGSSSSSSSSPGHACLTPDPWKKPGHCVVLNNCKELHDLLRAARFNPKGRPDGNVTDLLRRSHCGFDGGVPRVCCADAAPSTPSSEQWAAGGAGGGLDNGGGDGSDRYPANVASTDRFNPNGASILSPQPMVPEEMALPLDSYPSYPAPAAAPAAAPPPAKGPSGDDHYSASRESAPNTPREPPRSPPREPAYSPPSRGPASGSGSSSSGPPSDPDRGYPAENLGLLPTEVCGMRFHQQAQQNGNRSGLMQYPWMARLGYRQNEREHGDSDRLEYLCTGSLISERYVLTAAHCIATLNGPASVRLGELDALVDPDCADPQTCAPSVLDIAVEEMLVHHEYRQGLNDIGLLRLARPATFSEAVNPVCLPIPVQGRPEEELAGRTMTVASWGNTSPYRRQHAPSRWLLHHRSQVLSPGRCSSLYDSLDDVTFDASMHLCVGGGCQGDSGSPLMLAEDAASQSAAWPTRQRAMLYGVLSYGQPDCALRAAPLVFTKVSRYVPWVLKNLKPNPFVPKDPVSSSTRLVDPRVNPGRTHY